jgi:uncharacterized repeat protein (TIGR03847 family)
MTMGAELSDPDHVTADFVGEPGERTFYVQASESGEMVTVVVEKEQVAALADALARLLAEVGAEPSAVWDVASMRLREPVDPLWRGGRLTVGLDPQLGRFMLEIHEFVPDDELREPDEVRVWFDDEAAARLAAHAAWAVAQGRPTCELCGNPLDPDGHVCPRGNGDLREQ